MASDVAESEKRYYFIIDPGVIEARMTRSIADLSLDELDRIGQEAGAAAVERTLDAGISTLGVVDGTALQVKPDRSVHDLGPIAALDAAFVQAVRLTQAEAERPHGIRPGPVPPTFEMGREVSYRAIDTAMQAAEALAVPASALTGLAAVIGDKEKRSQSGAH